MIKEIRIEMTGPGRGKVIVDGQEMHGVVGVNFSTRVGQANVVTLEVLARTVTVTGECKVKTKSA